MIAAGCDHGGYRLDKEMEKNFLAILAEELVPAMGCTEPIALAYAAATAKSVLGCKPDRIVAKCSGNIVKNVRCVTIPNTEGMTGIEAAVAVGALGGDAGRKMEVMEGVTKENLAAAKELLDRGACSVEYLNSEIPLHFIVEVFSGENSAGVEIRYAHTNITSILKNGKSVYAADSDAATQNTGANRALLSIENIKAFADEVELSKIAPFCERQVRYNMDIAYEGMTGRYGVGIGPMLRAAYAESTITRMKAYTAAASEARMGGCDMPVMITSGSGNQGIASSVPIIVYAHENNIPREKMYRALSFSSLMTIFQKEFIGKLSAFCGAVSASCAAGAAITYLVGGTIDQIKATIDNALADIPGIICDGAKVSCAAKIATSLDAAMMAHNLAMAGKAYEAYTGILKEDAGETIRCVGYIGKYGMQQTDKEIIKMMLK